MSTNKQQTKGYKMKNKVKKIVGGLITATIFSTVVMSAANAGCTGQWIGQIWYYSCTTW